MARRKKRRSPVRRLGDRPSAHAREADTWLRHFRDEAAWTEELIAKGQCHRAYRALVRMDRKATMAGVHAGRSRNESLNQRARANNERFSKIEEEFERRCLPSLDDEM